jgi:hypothetical protein
MGMDLTHVADFEILSRAEKLAADERTLTIELLFHLREIDNRRLFCDLKCGSLLEYVMKYLKFSEDQACRRITAMRLLRDLPKNESAEIAAKIAEGGLNLSNIGLAQSLFNHERIMGRPPTSEQKMEVLNRIAGKSAREAQKIAREISPGFKPARSITYDDIQDHELRQKLLQVQGKFAHTHPALSLPNLLHLLCDRELSATSRIRDEIFRRDGKKCSNCGSTYALQIDHRIPRAAGGSDDPANLRVLCRKCNQRAAIAYYGREKMSRFLEDKS